MMTKIYKYIVCILSVTLFVACEKGDSYDVSDVTNFAVFTLKGDNVILQPKGEPYVDPGASAAEAGTPVEVTTTSLGTFRGGSLDVNVPDIYSVSYSAVNKDGFQASASRTVVVAENGDLITDISGLYKSWVTRNGTISAPYENIEYILIWKNADGTFSLSDAIGGYYMYGRSYGSAYAATGSKITVNGLGDYNLGPDFAVGAFGGVATITQFSVDPVAKTIDFETDWDAGYLFAVHLEQVQF